MAQLISASPMTARRTTRLLPQTYFLASLVLMFVLHFICPMKMPMAFYWRLAGILPITAGCALNMIADHQFRQHHTTTRSFGRPDNLITDGVFRVSRNPMYLGMVLVAGGIALLEGDACSWLSVLALATILHHLFIVPEEAIVQETFGAEAQRYNSRVRRWL